jgi:UTP-glucose-1-phosphate uridylyltransferase
VVDKFLEKPESNETNSRNGVVGKYVLTSDIFQYLEEAESKRSTGEIRLADAFELMRQKQDIYGLEIEGKRYDT